jgi:hypothetical protein
MPLTFRHPDECAFHELLSVRQLALVQQSSQLRKVLKRILWVAILWAAVSDRILVELPAFLLDLAPDHSTELPIANGKRVRPDTRGFFVP